MDEAVLKSLGSYLEQRTPENFLLLREVVANSAAYSPYDSDPACAYEFLDRGDFQQAKTKLQAIIPGCFLNPGAHKLLSFVMHKLGDETAAGVEFSVSMLFLNGILASGDGSREKPYLVLQTTDEYDVAEHLEKEVVGQALIEADRATYDRLDCKDGTEIWFDITIPFSFMSKRFEGKG